MIYTIPIILGVLLYRFLSKKNLIWVMALGYILIGGLRALSVGYDTATYYGKFLTVSNLSLGEVFEDHIEEVGFYLLAKLISYLGGSFQFLQFVIYSLWFWGIGRLILKYSPLPIISFTMLIPMQYFSFCLSAERQTLAMGLVLIGVRYILEQRSCLRWCIVIAIAYCFHNSSIVAFPLYFLYIKDLNYKKRLLTLLLIPIIVVLRNTILEYALQFMYTDYQLYEMEQGSYATLLVYIAIWVLYLFSKQGQTGQSVTNNFFEAAAIIGIILQLFVPLEPNIYRLAFYYQIFNILLLPIALYNLQSPLRQSSYAITLGVLGIMYFYFTYFSSAINPYYFFWEKSLI